MNRVLSYASLLPTIAAILGGTLPAQAQPYNYQPLEPGWDWYYEGTFGTPEHTSSVGELEVWGVPTAILEIEVGGGSAQIYQNYWTVNTEGDLFLHGAHNITYDVRFAYDPPILWLDAPLFRGKTWTTEYRVCQDFDPNECSVLLTMNIIINFEGPITVPAGTFPCYGMALNASAGALRDGDQQFSVTGRHLGTDGADGGWRDFGDAYSDGVGLVQHPWLDSEIIQLALLNPTTPVDERTWAAVKSYYRR